MKTKDLMIGDWVLNTLGKMIRISQISLRDNIYRISGIYHNGTSEIIETYPPSEINPIPITAEILKKNGWAPMIVESESEELRRTDCLSLNIAKPSGFNGWYLGSLRNGLFRPTTHVSGVHELQRVFKVFFFEEDVKL